MIRRWIKEHFGLFDLEDLTVGGNCGCCGAWMKDAILPRDWTWGVCKRCLGV